MDRISKYNVVRHLKKRSLLIAINCVAALAVFFFGYDQGMMGSVNVSVDYAVNTMKFGHLEGENTVVVDDSLFQGGIVGFFDIPCLTLLMERRPRFITSEPFWDACSVVGSVRRLVESRSSPWDPSGVYLVPVCKPLLKTPTG